MNADQLLDLLRCPACGATLVRDGDWLVCTDPAARLRYPVRGGLPVMLPDEAEQMTEADWRAAIDRTAGKGT